jgi:hypothetical protein
MQPYPERRVFFVSRLTLFIELFAEISHVDPQRTQRLPNSRSGLGASRWNTQINVTNKRHACRDARVLVCSVVIKTIVLSLAATKQNVWLLMDRHHRPHSCANLMTSRGIVNETQETISKSSRPDQRLLVFSLHNQGLLSLHGRRSIQSD